jgi:UDP-N-acetylglucosamine 2-epimerase (non-hydrolysing)
MALKLLHVVGARPNFMKVGPVIDAFAAHSEVEQRLVHTGQHYDANMSEVFFRQLGLPEPDINLEVGSASHAQQTAQIMMQFETVVLDYRPDWVLVYGDVNSTVAAAVVCAKLLIPVAHVEAGLRSFDRTMPEEINRLLTDQIADLLFTPSADGNENLRREGVAEDKIHCVGNVMIDTLIRLLPQAEARDVAVQLGFDPGPDYMLVTLHRPSNVDDPDTLTRLVKALDDLSQQLPVLFAVHPRTRQRMADLTPQSASTTLHLLDPIGYLDFLALQKNATVVITDSGGIQEETTYLGVPCLTMRTNTERPITVDLGTNQLIGQDTERMRTEALHIISGKVTPSQIPPLWDGHTGARIAEIILAR